MKRVRKLMLLVMLLVLAAMPMNVRAASQKTKAMSAYKTFLAQTTGAYGGDYDKFALAYIDKNSVPELLFRDPIYTYVYTYKNGRVTLMHKDQSMNVFKYYKKKGIIVRFYAHRGLQTTTWLRLSDGSFTEYLGTQKYGSTAYYKYVRQNSYYTEKSVTKSKFNKLLKKYVGTKKVSSIKFYKNTAANRKKRLK